MGCLGRLIVENRNVHKSAASFPGRSPGWLKSEQRPPVLQSPSPEGSGEEQNRPPAATCSRPAPSETGRLAPPAQAPGQSGKRVAGTTKGKASKKTESG